jgi:peptidoglycan/LPS O-acetylase OafA/YrhL
LRGVAAFIVFIDHFMVHWFKNLKFGYGSSEENSFLLQLPIIRLLFSGRASVAVFFVISGYVLSAKPLSLIRSGKMGELGQVLGSAVLRRGLRLYLPIIAGTFISMLLAGKGWYLNVPAQTETIPPTFETWNEQIWHWVDCTGDLVFPFRDVSLRRPFSPDYNGHLWTIPVEFFGSLVVFVTVLGLGGVRSKIRLGIVAALAIWALDWGRWDVFLFLGGVLLAEINLSSEANETSSELPFSASQSPKPRWRFPRSISISSLRSLLRPVSNVATKLNFPLLLLSLYLLSFTGDTPLIIPSYTPNPDLTTLPSDDTLPSDANLLPEPEPSPPLPNHGSFYTTLPSLIPTTYASLWNGPEFFILSLAAVLLLFSLSTSKKLQRPFESRLAQYLGDVSYSLYIMHGMVLFSLGTHLERRWTGGPDYGPWVPPIFVDGEEWEGEGGVQPVRDVLGWGMQGTYGEGIVYSRDLGTDTVMGGLGDGVGGIGGVGIGADEWRYGKAFFVAGVINLVVVLWAADLFWRSVDRPSVRMARKVEGWISRRR